MTTPYDEIPVEVRRDMWGWFGDPWWSYVCFDEDGRLIEEMRKPFPAGDCCLYCGERFSEAAGDSGQAFPVVAAEGVRVRHGHKECAFVNVIGSLAHHEGRCSCHGGDGTGTGMTLRQEALEVWKRHREGTLRGRQA